MPNHRIDTRHNLITASLREFERIGIVKDWWVNTPDREVKWHVSVNYMGCSVRSLSTRDVEMFILGVKATLDNKGDSTR